jgi:hypothetical protein
MNGHHLRRLTVCILAATTALGLLVAAPAPEVSAALDPSMSISAQCGPTGATQLSVVVANVDPADTLFFTLAEDESVALPQSPVGPGGELTLSLPALANGEHTIEMWLTAPGEEFGEVFDSAGYQVPCPSVTVAPAQLALHAGSLPLDLTGDGYFGRGDVVFALDGTEIARTRPRAGVARTGAVLPAVPGCGSHEISSEQAHAPEDFDPAAQTTLVVTCPTLTADPTSVAQSTLPTSVLVTGAGWDLHRALTLSIDGAVVATATADGAGRFTTTVPVAPRPCGSVPVVAAEVPLPPTVAGPVPTATTMVEVTCSTPPPANRTDPTPPAKPAPTLVAEPVVSSGGVDLASGHGFAAGATVRLVWVLPDGTLAPGAVTTVAATDGSISAPCPVLPHARLGPRTLRADQSTAMASAQVLVVNGPMEPGRDRLLGRR